MVRSTVRVRVSTQAPLPAAQFVVPVRAGDESLEDVRERILASLRRHYPAPVLDEVEIGGLALYVDGYELLDEFGTELLKDSESVRYVLWLMQCCLSLGRGYAAEQAAAPWVG